MARDDQVDIRGEMLRFLMWKVSQDRYPSATMLDMIEGLLTPQEAPMYARLLLDKVEGETYPSLSLMNRLLALA